MSEHVRYFCTEETFKSFICYDIESFDVFKNFDILHEYYKKVVLNYSQSVEDLKESFLEEIEDNGTWFEYVILEDSEIAARAGIWKINDNPYEIVAVSTDPKYQRKGYAASLVSFCTQKILNECKDASCITGVNNIAMRKTLEKLGFILKK